MNLWWWMTVALMLGAAGLLYAGMQRERSPMRISRRFEEALRSNGIHLATHRSWLERLAANSWLLAKLERISSSEIEEMQRVLVQAGWGTQQTRFYFLLAGWLAPAVGALGIGLYLRLEQMPTTDLLLRMAFAFAFLFVGMRRMLRWRAKQRQQAIRKEVITWLHLQRMLFDAGLSLEHTLQVIEQQARTLIPNLAVELEAVVKRIRAGQDRADALAEMAVPLEVPELNDTVAMLRQVTRQGGNVRDALIEYTKLIEQRQFSELREYVGKLSAKMTVVMVLFLFPALLIFVAGPGFVGLASALKNVGG